jgi:DNA-binding transcriptional regulator YdaS (Cro superfamily)
VKRAVLASAIALAALTACSVEPAVTGTVTARDMRPNPATHSEAYYLTIATATGTAEHQVYVDTYDRCPLGSAYPTCKQ